MHIFILYFFYLYIKLYFFVSIVLLQIFPVCSQIKDDEGDDVEENEEGMTMKALQVCKRLVSITTSSRPTSGELDDLHIIIERTRISLKV